MTSRASCARSGLDPRTLKLEITESIVMKDAETAIATLRALKAHRFPTGH